MGAKKSFSLGMGSGDSVNNPNRISEMQAKKNYRFEYIPKEKIIKNEKNLKYEQVDIETLKFSILYNGLIHNLSVLYNGETDVYKLISGERRYRAICSMSDKEYKQMFPMGIPCKIESADTNEIDEEIKLIMANSEVRQESQEVRMWEVNRLKELFTAKKDSGEITNIAKEIAKSLNISERQTVKYMNAANLIPELKELLNSKGISITDASKYAALDEPAQKQILSLISSNGIVEPDEFKAIKENEEKQKQENKELIQKINELEKELKSKNSKSEILEKQYNDMKESEDVNDDNESELAILKREKETACRECERLANNLDSLKQKMKEKESRNITLSETEMKKIASISKIEQILDLYESNMHTLKMNKSLIMSDETFKSRLEIFSERISSLINP